MLRIIFMGTSSFGIPCLDYLSSRDDISIQAVVTKPPRPRGRGRILKDAPIKKLAMEKGLTVLEPGDINKDGFVRDLENLKPDLTIVVSFGKILPKSILNIPRYGSINIHPSLLPLYRGPSPINWAIINGDKETGVTSFFIEEGMDTGPIISQQSSPIQQEDDSEMLGDRLKNLAIEVLEETLDKIEKGTVQAQVQDSTRATLAPKITSKTGHIDWSWEGEKICNLIRGLSPRPGAYSFFKNSRFINGQEDEALLVKIWKAEYVKNASADIKVRGRIMGVEINGLKVFSGKGIVLIQELQPAGKKRMTGKAFLSGYD